MFHSLIGYSAVLSFTEIVKLKIGEKDNLERNACIEQDTRRNYLLNDIVLWIVASEKQYIKELKC